MAIHKLTQSEYEKLVRRKRPGLYGDGGKLYLQILKTGSMSWLFRYTFQGRVRAFGLGPIHTVDLEAARAAARDMRLRVLQGHDPVAERRAEQAAMSFGEVIDAYLGKTDRPNEGWASMLATYCEPIADKPANHVNPDDVYSVLQPIWRSKHPTAKKLRLRIETVLDFAVHMIPPQRSQDVPNPASWAIMKNRLSKTSDVHHVTNLEAMPYQELPAFMAGLRARAGDIAARALEFVMLTACRSGDITGKPAALSKDGQHVLKAAKPAMMWADIKWSERVWEPPSPPGRKPLVPVPLTDAAIAALKLAQSYGLDREVVFPIGKNGMYNVLKEMTPGHEYTVHGTSRAGFRTWADEETDAQTEVAEQCLSHKGLGEQTVLAYRRSAMFKKRTRLLDEWAAFLAGAEVVPIRRARAGAEERAVA